jgi:alkaline phosphatase D
VSALDRRAFLRALGLAPLVALQGCAGDLLRATARSQIEYGPATFEVAGHSALVWHRLSAPGRAHIEYAPVGGGAAPSRTPVVTVTADSDLTMTVTLDRLAPDREYQFRAVVEGATDPGPLGRFRTAPVAAEEFTFAWSADIEAGHQPFTIFDAMARRAPRFFVFLGDTVYADHPRTSFEPTLTYYRYKHRENRDDRHLGGFLGGMPVFAMWDDHEVQNDFNATNPFIPQGRQAFGEYWPIRGGDVLYRRFSWGAGADFFALDCRQYRSPQSDPDGPAKTMLGARQKAWLKDGLRQSRAPAKFLLTSVPLQGPWGADRWAGYATERDELLRFLHDEKIRGVIVLSGDVHTAVDIELDGGPREFVAGPLGAWPSCRIAPRIKPLLEASGRFFICDAFNCGLVTVRPQASPPEVEVRYLDAADVVRYTTRVPLA